MKFRNIFASKKKNKKGKLNPRALSKAQMQDTAYIRSQPTAVHLLSNTVRGNEPTLVERMAKAMRNLGGLVVQEFHYVRCTPEAYNAVCEQFRKDSQKDSPVKDSVVPDYFGYPLVIIGDKTDLQYIAQGKKALTLR